MDRRYFFARQTTDGVSVSVRGTNQCTLGHVLEQHDDASPDGIFASWNWNGEKLTIRNDRYGFYPLFYFHRADEFGVSPSLVTLVEQGAATELDAPGLAFFLRTGFFLGEDTPFKHIKVVPPDAHLEWNGELHIAGGERVFSGCQDIKRDEAIERYSHLFKQAIKKRLSVDGEYALPLSGGRDSRHILLELCELGCRPKYCITINRHPTRLSSDVQVASAVAKELNLKHIVAPAPPRFTAERRKNILTHFCAERHGWIVGMSDYMREMVNTFYDGIAGDVLSQSMFHRQDLWDSYREGRFDELANNILGDEAYKLPAIFGEIHDAEQLRHEVHERLVGELKRYAEATNPISMFYFWNRTRRDIALSPFGISHHIERCFCPYLDHQLYDFLTSLPLTIFQDKKFHTETINRAYPKYAYIAYARRDIQTSTRERLKFAAHLALYCLQMPSQRGANLSNIVKEIVGSVQHSGSQQQHPPLSQLFYLIQLQQLRDGVLRA